MADSWERLKQECGVCRGCALADTRTHVVFGDGCETAEIMLIGEGPGQHEDEQGIPFVGRPGSCWTICWRSSIWTAPRSTSPTW